MNAINRSSVLISSAILAIAGSAVQGSASSPQAGTLSPIMRKITWTGGPLLPGRGVPGTSSDLFGLRVDVPPGYRVDHPLTAVRVKVTFDVGSDLDVAVTNVAGKWARSSTARGGTFDQVTMLQPVNGEYTITVTPFEPLAGTYQGSAELLELPPTSARSGSAPSEITFQPNTVVDPDPLAGGSEPNVAVDSQNRIFVTAPHKNVLVYRSDDHGVTFKKLGDFASDSADGGGHDADIEIDRNNNLYIADLAVASINVLKSTDHGKTFPQIAYTGYESDRQWLATHGDQTVYLGYHDIGTQNEVMFRSDDGGVTFLQATPVQQTGQSTGDCTANTYSGPVRVADDETVYIVYACSNVVTNLTSVPPFAGPANAIYVAVSHDRGVTFSEHKAVAYPAGANVGNLFPAMALDSAGNPYVSYSLTRTSTGPAEVYVAYSTDQAKTWHEPIKVTSSTGSRVFPWIAAGDPGRVDLVFAESPTTSNEDLNGVWNVKMAQSLNLLSASPTFSHVAVSDLPMHLGQICISGIFCSTGGDRSLSDFIEVGLDQFGRANVIWTDNGRGEKHLVFARQSGGPSLLAPKVLGRTTSKPSIKPRGTLPATGADDARAFALMVLVCAALLARRARVRAI